MVAAPVIEGSLKNMIHSVSFGLIVTTLGVNFGKLFLQNFFPYMMGIVIVAEALLFSLDKPKQIYDKYQPAGIKGRHTIDGAGAPQITVSSPDQDPDAPVKKRDKIKDKKAAKKDSKGRQGSGMPPGSPAKQRPMQSLNVPPPTSAMEVVKEEDMGVGETGKDKSEKEKRKEQEREKKKDKEEEKEKQKAEKERMKESEDEKSEKGGWRKRNKKETSK